MTPESIDDTLLRAWPLPTHDGEDKEGRGRALIVAGSPEMPGAAILAATAALRVGAGKVQVAVVSSIAPLVAVAVPEARVIALPQTVEGGIAPPAAEKIVELANECAAVLLGPGLQDEYATCALVQRALPQIESASVLLDAFAMGVVCARQPEGDDEWNISRDASASESQSKRAEAPNRFARPVLMTPHAGEMAHLTARSKERIEAGPADIAQRASSRWNAVIALKGATTYVAAPEGRVLQHDGGNEGLACSGSGDVLAGLIAGLLARGATLMQAAAFGVALHARAGEVLAHRYGRIGYLARELAAEVPALMQALAQTSGHSGRVHGRGQMRGSTDQGTDNLVMPATGGTHGRA